MDWLGLGLLALSLAAILTTGWSTWAVLLGACTLGAAAGVAAGTFDLRTLSSLGARVTGLLDNDLLQALALYGLVGALLIRLDLADATYRGLQAGLRRVLPGAAPGVAGLSLGTLLAPINGSVGASVVTLSRTAAARWDEAGVPPGRRTALVAVASTLGAIVPPSLVLLLLGDAMLRAHTEGLNLAKAMSLPVAEMRVRVVNTQDIVQAVLVPGALLLAGWMVLAARVTRLGAARAAEVPPPRATRREVAVAIIVPVAIVALLGLVAVGRVRPVEAAAAAGVSLFLWGLVSRQLDRARLRAVLDDALTLTGTLFALLVAATTLSLVLRLLGTDKLIAGWMLAMQAHPEWTVLVALAIVLACAFILDAFELIFLVVPLVVPPLLAVVPDAGWVAVLVLLILQLGFLVPPFGYAFVQARALVDPAPAMRTVARSLTPFLAWLVVVIGLVWAFPALTHVARTVPMILPAPVELSPEEMEKRMRSMMAPDEEEN